MERAGVGLCGLDWIKRKRWPPHPGPARGTLSLVDLFCGCGGLTLGAWEAARASSKHLGIRLAVDTSADAIAVYRQNFETRSKVARCQDVRELFPGAPGDRLTAGERRLRQAVGRVDVVVAGPPCQGHSDLNNHTRRSDPRNGLYLTVIRAANVLRPKAVIIENVPTVTLDKSRAVQTGAGHLERLGYRVSTFMTDASCFGLPQRRKRHILVAVNGPRTELQAVPPFHNGTLVPLSCFLTGLEDEPKQHQGLFYTPSRMTDRNRERVAYLFKNRAYDLPNSLRPPCHRDNDHSYRSMYGRLHWDQPAQTITTGFGSMGQGRFVHPTRRRMITPHEAARVQGFPDFFDFSATKKRTVLQEMIGNAVPPGVAANLIHAIFHVTRS